MEKLKKLLPESMMGWSPKEEDGVYTADTLFDLIDGGAEVYRALNVRTILSRRYAREGEPDIIIDVFDMGCASDAFGAYHHDMREGESAGVGQGSEFLDSSLYFWKGQYFVSLISFDETDESGKALKAFAKSIADAIPSEGELPELVRLLPEKGLVKKRIHYFHDQMLLDRHYFLSEENILMLSKKTEGVIAGYNSEGLTVLRGMNPKHKPLATVLLLIKYPDRNLSKKAYYSFMKNYLPDADANARVGADHTGWTAAAMEGDLVMVLFDAVTADEVDRIFTEVKANRKVKEISK